MCPPAIHERLPTDELPDVGVEGSEFLLACQKRYGVPNGAVNLEPVSHDPGIGEERFDSRRSKSGDTSGIELRKRLSISQPLLEDRFPAQTGLRALERQEFEQDAIVVDRHAPLRIMVRDAQWRLRPRAARSCNGLLRHFDCDRTNRTSPAVTSSH